ncbi:alpha-aminoadipic semialdehyde synthase isoform X1 [Benincasa hispida]|uniref:alpha-aminoadipic semialdehyde synthase isoform X1 n=1 Tax=Benincasa hispida TaxID=102211 RepID=UPI001900A3FD|nr:alpha-aminoadipic semialdehyde synthase isoform X1 [Benincasa hispida]XP_038879309.1 alpha-aminoadipic semialdehyde synthase isoform X1 [Benincasa hispida]XP_038879310.1 alpha-aminoadipic semialdehyde synthase isoform X1 [Benincasa hispida]
MLGNGVVGILSESCNKWERRVPLAPEHCARLLHGGRQKTGISRIIIQPSTKRIYHDAQYEDVGCEIFEDLSECGLILGVKQPKLEMILPDRAYGFFSHTHKAQKENMPLLDKILSEKASLYDYELIVGDHGKRLLAFGKYAGRAGFIDILHGLGQRYLSLGISTPFLSLGMSYMYPSLASAKAAVIAVGEEIATQGLPPEICPLVIVFTGSGNVSHGAQEIFKLLPHTFVDPGKLPEICGKNVELRQHGATKKRVFQVFGSVVSCQHMVEHKDSTKKYDRVDYYAHPDQYRPIFHEKIAPYASVIVNCMYWEGRFPRLLTTVQFQDLMRSGCPLVGISDITCDVGGSIEFINQTTSIDSPFFRYDPIKDSYHHDLEGNGVICSAVDILPTEFAKEASQHFGDILSAFVGSLASVVDILELPMHLRRACIVHRGALTSLYEYIPRMRKSESEEFSVDIANGHSNKKFNIQVSLSGHLFDQFLINEALDIIEAAGGSFHLVHCQVGQNANAMSHSDLEIGADDIVILDKIIYSLSLMANPEENLNLVNNEINKIFIKVGKIQESSHKSEDVKRKTAVLLLGAGRVCYPAVDLLASNGRNSCCQFWKTFLEHYAEDWNDIEVIVASLYLKDAEEITEDIANATAVQLDITDSEKLFMYISQVEVVISLLPPSCHLTVANACIELGKHLVTASYINDTMSLLDEKARNAGITILGEMGLDPGIDHMLAMKMINESHLQKRIVKSFVSYCGGIPSPESANNPLAYKFSWNPAGAIRAGSNPATYKYEGKTVKVEGKDLYDSAVRLRLPDLPAFALECIPNRNSLIYGDVYGIGHEALTIFRGTLRYEGFSKVMGTLARIGFLDTEVHSFLRNGRPLFRDFLLELLKIKGDSINSTIGEKDISESIISSGLCKEQETAVRVAKTIVFLGLHEPTEIPSSCQSAFDVTCYRMEERLTYLKNEQDMVLLHHEIQVAMPDGQHTECRKATLLEFGRTRNGKSTSAMALTVGIPAAIGALLLLTNKIKTRGVLRPIESEVYIPALDLLQAYGFKLTEKVEY